MGTVFRSSCSSFHPPLDHQSLSIDDYINTEDDANIGDGFPGEASTLRIPETNMNKLEVKRFSWWRTGIVILGGAVGTLSGFDVLCTGSEGTIGGVNAL